MGPFTADDAALHADDDDASSQLTLRSGKTSAFSTRCVASHPISTHASSLRDPSCVLGLHIALPLTYQCW